MWFSAFTFAFYIFNFAFSCGTVIADGELGCPNPPSLKSPESRADTSSRMKKNPTSQAGFSLIELLIVVAILGIIAAIAVPYLESARQATKSASAINSIRTINSSQASFRSATGRYGTLEELGNGNYIADSSLIAGEKSGYTFSVSSATDLNYEAVADPIFDPTGAFQHYYIDASGVIRAEVGQAATLASNPLP